MAASSAPLAMLRDARRRPAGDGGLLSMRAELIGGSNFLVSAVGRARSCPPPEALRGEMAGTSVPALRFGSGGTRAIAAPWKGSIPDACLRAHIGRRRAE